MQSLSWAASALALATTAAQASTSSVPASRMLRSEWVPPPPSTTRVSPVTNRIVSISTPSWSATTWAKVVSCPWPVDWVPATTVTSPSVPTLTSTRSRGAPTGDSM